MVLEPEEKKALTLLQQMRALNKEKVGKRKEKQEERRGVHRKAVTREAEKKGEKKKEERKEYMRVAGIKKKREMELEDGGSRKKRKV